MRISVFGLSNLEKSIFVKRVINFLGLETDNYQNIKKTQNNYLEDIFYQNQNQFTIVNLPYFPLFEELKSTDAISKKVADLNREEIKKNDHSILIFNLDNVRDNNFSRFVNFVEKNSKRCSFVYFDSLNREFFSEKFSFKNKNFYNIKFYPLAKSKIEIRHFLKKEFEISENIQCTKEKEQKKSLINCVIIGPPNSGKSSLLNSIIGYQRSVVSDVQGTTREEIKSNFAYKQWDFNIFDTEGVSEKEDVNSINSIKSSDLILIVLDITKEISKRLLQIVETSYHHGSPLIIVLNKLDLVEKYEAKEKILNLRARLKSFSFVPIIYLSATKKLNFKSFFEKIETIINESKVVISKKLVTSYVNYLVEKNQPPLINGKRLKFYYGFHEKGFVHKIIFFVNDPKCVHFSYQRYILNNFRKKTGINNLPIRFFFKKS